jgi:hypothetical protein
MPFRVTRLDYIVTTIVFIMFLIAFFCLSDTIGMYQQCYEKRYYTVNDFVIIGPIVIIYEMFQILVLPGKRRGRELPWKLYIQIAKQKIINKTRSGIQEYHEWKKTK